MKAQRLNKQAAEKRAYSGIGYVASSANIFPNLTVEKTCALVCLWRVSGTTRPFKRLFKRNSRENLRTFPRIKRKHAASSWGDLSGGQQQTSWRLGRALVWSPSVLILDEPMKVYQPNIVKQIGDVILTQ